MIDSCDAADEGKATPNVSGTTNMNLRDSTGLSEHEGDHEEEAAATAVREVEHLQVDSSTNEDPIGFEDQPGSSSSSSEMLPEVVSSDTPLVLVNSLEEKERPEEEMSFSSGGVVNPQDDHSKEKGDDETIPLPQDKETEDVAFTSYRRLSWDPSLNLCSIDATGGIEDVAIVTSELANEDRRGSTSSIDSDFLSRRHSIGSNSSYSLDKKDSIWTRLAKRSDVWEDDEEDDEERFSCKKLCKDLYVEEIVAIKAKWNLLKAHPRIGIIGVVSFIIFCASSFAVIYTFNYHYNQRKNDEALKTSENLVHRFEDQLTSATLPLFSIAEFVKDLPYFIELPYKIGPGGEAGSAPFSQEDPTYRNVSGICDNNATMENFDRLANNMKQSADLNGILLQLQLAPAGVVCLIHPKNNTEDFNPPLFLDGSYLIGQDTLADPHLRGVGQQTLSTNDTINIDGPFAVQACHTSDNCPIAVQNALIARLPIIMPGYNMSINGTTYPTWGFASELINGDALVERAFADYKLHGSQYRLIKIQDGEVYVLKQSPDADKVTLFQNSSVKTLNGQWIAQVGYAGVSLPPWLGGVIAASLLISVLLSWMLMLIFFEKQAHQDLLKEMLPRKALKKIQRGETVVEKYSMVTIFFCDIVGYTSISADMRPIQVMKLLNTYYNEVDKLASKHKVFKIETIGDSYMCVGGCPERCLGSEAAEHVALFALELVELVKNFSTEDGMQIVIRAGMNSGPVVAGVVGTNRPQYTVFGDAVNAAARMETTSERMKIQCSEMSYRLLRDAPNYQFSLLERGDVEVKGKGRMQTWFVDSATKRVMDDSIDTVEVEASYSTGIVNSSGGGDSSD